MDPNQGNTLVETPDNPASNVGAESEFTEENLEANILAQLDLPTDASTGDVIETPAATEVPGEQPAATEPKVEETKPAEVVDEATFHRTSQENKDLRATLIKLGVDPDGSTAEQLRSGVVTVDDLIHARASEVTSTPQTPEPTTPQVPLSQKITNLQDRLSKEGDVTAKSYKEDMKAAMEVITGLAQANQNISQTLEANNANNLLTSVQNATKNVFSTEVKSATLIPEDVLPIAENFFVGATDLGAGKFAGQVGRERAFTPEGYTHVAKSITPEFDQLVQAIHKAGQDAAIAAIKKANPTLNTATVVNPITPGAGGGTPPPPTEQSNMTIDNLEANVNKYMAETAARV
jgi:hypothetical protein